MQKAGRHKSFIFFCVFLALLSHEYCHPRLYPQIQSHVFRILFLWYKLHEIINISRNFSKHSRTPKFVYIIGIQLNTILPCSSHSFLCISLIFDLLQNFFRFRLSADKNCRCIFFDQFKFLSCCCKLIIFILEESKNVLFIKACLPGVIKCLEILLDSFQG